MDAGEVAQDVLLTVFDKLNASVEIIALLPVATRRGQRRSRAQKQKQGGTQRITRRSDAGF